MDIKPPYGYQDIVPLARTHRVLLPAARRVPPALRGLNALPLSFTEFAAALRDYPIAFVSGDNGSSFVAMAILGVDAQRNLFVGEDGLWDAGTYLPAYVRRHPFCMTRVMIDGREQAERVACVEKSALQAGGTALYDDLGRPLPVWEQLSQLLFEFETDLARTEALCRTLQELQLLEPFSAQALPAGESPITLTGMHRVSETGLQTLPAERLQQLARNGMLPRIYAHLMSLDNFQRLLDRRAAQQPAARVAPEKLN